jgi:hypothetical protein
MSSKPATKSATVNPADKVYNVKMDVETPDPIGKCMEPEIAINLMVDVLRPILQDFAHAAIKSQDAMKERSAARLTFVVKVTIAAHDLRKSGNDVTGESLFKACAKYVTMYASAIGRKVTITASKTELAILAG